MGVRITVMHDYCAEPLWVSREGQARVPEAPQEHGLSPSLVGRLDAWQLWGDSRINMADPLDSRPVTDAEEDAFEAEGRLLARRVADELPNVTVLYGDGSAYQE